MKMCGEKKGDVARWMKGGVTDEEELLHLSLAERVAVPRREREKRKGTCELAVAGGIKKKRASIARSQRRTQHTILGRVKKKRASSPRELPEKIVFSPLPLP